MDATVLIRRAIEHAGSEAKLAAIIGCSQVAVNKAKHRGKVSAEMAIAIEKGTDGVVSRQELRPDLFGSTTPSIERASA